MLPVNSIFISLFTVRSFFDSAAYVSYGGLLMRIQGDANNLHGFQVDSHVYLFMKKLAFWVLYLTTAYYSITTAATSRIASNSSTASSNVLVLLLPYG